MQESVLDTKNNVVKEFLPDEPLLRQGFQPAWTIAVGYLNNAKI